MGEKNLLKQFQTPLVDGMGSLEKSKSWPPFAKDCNYITIDLYEQLLAEAEVLGTKIHRLHDNWKDFGAS